MKSNLKKPNSVKQKRSQRDWLILGIRGQVNALLPKFSLIERNRIKPLVRDFLLELYASSIATETAEQACPDVMGIIGVQ